MNKTVCLDDNYSTTKLVTIEKPEDKFESVLFLPEGEERKGEGGLRTRGYFKKSYEDKPLISIITVVYNGEQFLEETIKSIINQSYDNVEYIIIDGGSTDGTLDIIKKYEDRIDYWVSEKDEGIYDAMNKGIDLVSGDWINFMNAGDSFYINETLREIFYNNYNFTNINVIYGDLEIDYGDFRRFQKAKSLSGIWKGMIFSHQSSFIRASYHKMHKYSLNYKIAGDFEFFYKFYENNTQFEYIAITIAIVDVEGLSDANRVECLKQKYDVVSQEKFSIKYYFYYTYAYTDQYFRVLLKKILSKKIVNSIKAKHK